MSFHFCNILRTTGIYCDLCSSAGWSLALLMLYPKFFDFWRINTWLLCDIVSNLHGFFTIFPHLVFGSLPLSECCLCNVELPQSFSAYICLWMQYDWYTCRITARAISEFFCCPGQCYKFCPTTKVLQSVSYFPIVETFHYWKYLLQLFSLHVAKIIQYGHYYQLFF